MKIAGNASDILCKDIKEHLFWEDRETSESGCTIFLHSLAAPGLWTENNCYSISAPPPFLWLANDSRCDSIHLLRYSHYLLVQIKSCYYVSRLLCMNSWIVLLICLGMGGTVVAKLTLSTNWILFSFIKHRGTHYFTTIILPEH